MAKKKKKKTGAPAAAAPVGEAKAAPTEETDATVSNDTAALEVQQSSEPPKVAISDGTFTFSADKQTLEYFHDVSQGSVHTLTLSPGIRALK